MELRKSFQERIEELYIDLLRMANLCLERLSATRAAFMTLDLELADEIIAGDCDIDDYIVKIQELGIEIVATQAPVAIDLRRIIVIMWFSEHLERIGDLCVNICKAIHTISGAKISPWIKENIGDMFDRSRKMLERAIEGFKKKDPNINEELAQLDDLVDRINRVFLTRYDKDGEDTEVVVRIVMISRFLERIADHAVDIGENIHYMVTGRLLEDPECEIT